MKRFMKISLSFLAALLLFVAAQYLFRGSPQAFNVPQNKLILAHRGVHLNYQKGVYDRRSGCEAEHIFPPSHDYIENTVESIAAAFRFGADIVEIDIRMTADSNLVIFHDDRLDCRTDGKGPVRQKTVAELKQLDIGYGYTHDRGGSYPFRGKGIGRMPTLQDILQRFPDKSFLIDHKDWNTESADILIRLLAPYSPDQREKLYLWTSPAMEDKIRTAYPEMRSYFLLYSDVKEYFLPFFLSFGLIDIPDIYRGRVMAVPEKYLKYIWGWPYRFLSSVHRQGLSFHIMLDSEEAARRCSDLPVDGYVTDYIEITGPILNENSIPAPESGITQSLSADFYFFSVTE